MDFYKCTGSVAKEATTLIAFEAPKRIHLSAACPTYAWKTSRSQSGIRWDLCSTTVMVEDPAADCPHPGITTKKRSAEDMESPQCLSV